jgi:hypothetical protein
MVVAISVLAVLCVFLVLLCCIIVLLAVGAFFAHVFVAATVARSHPQPPHPLRPRTERPAFPLPARGVSAFAVRIFELSLALAPEAHCKQEVALQTFAL